MPTRHRSLPTFNSRAILILVSFILGVFLLILAVSVKRSEFFSHERVSIVWATNPVWVTTIHRSGSVGMVRIPADSYVRLTQGKGEYRIGVLWRLGTLDKKGGEVLQDTTQNFLGAPIDSWVGFTTASPALDGTGVDVLKHMEKAILQKTPITGSAITNLSWLDKLLVWWTFRSIEGSSIVVSDLEEEQVLTPIELADGSRALSANADLVDKVSHQLFWEDVLRKEKIVLEVYNASDIAGRASHAARVLNNIGVHVIGVSNSAPRKGCVLQINYTDRNRGSVDRVASIFGCTVSNQEDHVNTVGTLYLGN